MSDKLKRFIDDNREAFDSEDPGPRLLQNLTSRLSHNSRPKKKVALNFMHWAAATVGLVIVSIVLYYTMQWQNNTAIVEAGPDRVEERIEVADPVYASQIDHYRELIGLQQTELRKVEKEQPELYHQFAKDINQLDSAYRMLKTTLVSNPNKEMLLEAMISNLQLQTDLLNRQLLIIKEIKQKRKAHEKTNV